jgi:hypothetical protein
MDGIWKKYYDLFEAASRLPSAWLDLFEKDNPGAAEALKIWTKGKGPDESWHCKEEYRASDGAAYILISCELKRGLMYGTGYATHRFNVYCEVEPVKLPRTKTAPAQDAVADEEKEGKK